MMDAQQPASSERRKLTPVEQAACAWPMVLLFVGGAIGGACGGGAWAINTRIMSGNQSAPVRYLLVALTGVGAVVVWFLAVAALAIAFPDIFAR